MPYPFARNTCPPPMAVPGDSLVSAKELQCEDTDPSGATGCKWDGLKIRFDPFPTQGFLAHPRTVSEATSQGFVPVGSDSCTESEHYNGRAYVKGSDYSVTILYDINGFIAGLQAGIPIPSQPDTYPSENARPPLVLDGITNTRYIVTAYFIDPSAICTTGRSQNEFNQEGTGNSLWLQSGEYPNNLTSIPLQESQLDTTWVQGKCFPGMGVHYFYNISKTMDCKDIIPIFLLYNGGKLNSFGWVFPVDLASPIYEHPMPFIYPFFFKVIPDCVHQLGRISSIHIFLTNNPILNWC